MPRAIDPVTKLMLAQIEIVRLYYHIRNPIQLLSALHNAEQSLRRLYLARLAALFREEELRRSRRDPDTIWRGAYLGKRH